MFISIQGSVSKEAHFSTGSLKLREVGIKGVCVSVAVVGLRALYWW